MLLSKKLTTHYSAIRVLIAVCFIFVGPLLSGLHTSALSMEHGMQTTQSCESLCAGNQRTGLHLEANIVQDEKNISAPPIDEPYYLQFQNVSFPKPLPPQELILSSSYKPPDLNILHSIFRF